MSQLVLDGAACRPNIGAAGRRKRRQVAIIAAVVTVIGFASAMVLHVPALMRMLVALPAFMAVLCALQVTRNTCVAHAATGSIEGEDFSLTRADEEFAAASRKVAKTIYRDAGLAAAVVAALAYGSAWLY
ncbi:MAG: hypothetical protein ACO1OB_24125 [Archangium sp.]